MAGSSTVEKNVYLVVVKVWRNTLRWDRRWVPVLLTQNLNSHTKTKA